jgi:hypothetical protein
MRELAHGACVPRALSHKDALKAAAAMAKRDAAARAAASALFPFSPGAHITMAGAILSNNCLTVTRTTGEVNRCAWARSKRGVAAGCGVARWAVQLGAGACFAVGIASERGRMH